MYLGQLVLFPAVESLQVILYLYYMLAYVLVQKRNLKLYLLKKCAFFASFLKFVKYQLKRILSILKK